jgi:hypothetical protein
MQCQYEHGLRVATAQTPPWRDSVDSLPNTMTVHDVHPCRE